MGYLDDGVAEVDWGSTGVEGRVQNLWRVQLNPAYEYIYSMHSEILPALGLKLARRIPYTRRT
jgi:hypothetical protein